MKKYFTISLFLIIASTTFISKAQNKGLGVGIIVGEPTGFSGKYWTNEQNAFDLGLAYSFVGKFQAVSIHVDYLYHNFDFIQSNYRLPIYYGFGARIRLVDGEENSLGARGVIGVVWLNENLPIDLFIELAPVFNLFPVTSLNLDLALGARYYFN